MGTELSKRRSGHEMPHMQSKGKEDTKEHVLECQTAEAVYRIIDNTPNWKWYMEILYTNYTFTIHIEILA